MIKVYTHNWNTKTAKREMHSFKDATQWEEGTGQVTLVLKDAASQPVALFPMSSVLFLEVVKDGA